MNTYFKNLFANSKKEEADTILPMEIYEDQNIILDNVHEEKQGIYL